jgi:hypothetical protein
VMPVPAPATAPAVTAVYVPAKSATFFRL